MKRSTAAALLSLVLAPTPGLAADLGALPLTTPGRSGNDLVEVGTNWYIRGDLAVGFDDVPTLTYPGIATSLPGSAPVNVPAGSSNTFNTNFVGGLGVGYRYNDMLRFDATYEYRAGSGLNVTTTGIVCPYGDTSSSGYVYDTSQTCNSALTMKQHNNVVLANAYLDLGNYWGFTPYVGAGAGVNANSISGSATYTRAADGAAYTGVTVSPGTPNVWVDRNGNAVNPQPGIAFANQAWNQAINSTKYHFAFALTAGVGFALGPQATLDINYRYLNLGSTSVVFVNPTSGVIKTSSSAQDARIGIRYLLN
jgi:opacity protein-like surface antigen